MVSTAKYWTWKQISVELNFILVEPKKNVRLFRYLNNKKVNNKKLLGMSLIQMTSLFNVFVSCDYLFSKLLTLKSLMIKPLSTWSLESHNLRLSNNISRI